MMKRVSKQCRPRKEKEQSMNALDMIIMAYFDIIEPSKATLFLNLLVMAQSGSTWRRISPFHSLYDSTGLNKLPLRSLSYMQEGYCIVTSPAIISSSTNNSIQSLVTLQNLLTTPSPPHNWYETSHAHPEVNDVSASSDIFALGSTFYEIMQGSTPYEGL